MRRPLLAAVALMLTASLAGTPATAAVSSTTGAGVMYLDLRYTPGLQQAAAPQTIVGAGFENYNRYVINCVHDIGISVVYTGHLRLDAGGPVTGASTGPEGLLRGDGTLNFPGITGQAGDALVVEHHDALNAGAFVAQGASLSAKGTATYRRVGTVLAVTLNLTDLRIDPDGPGPIWGPVACANTAINGRLEAVFVPFEGNGVTSPVRRVEYIGAAVIL